MAIGIEQLNHLSINTVLTTDVELKNLEGVTSQVILDKIGLLTSGQLDSLGISNLTINGKIDGVVTKEDLINLIGLVSDLGDGLLTADDKIKLDGISEGATNYMHPSTHPASIIVQNSTNRFITDELLNKLDNIESLANNYNHPSTHPASIIVQNSTSRFVTDGEKSNWNNKVDSSLVYTKVESDARMQELIGAAPDALNTLVEIGNALNNDPDFAATIMTELSKKVSVGGELTTDIKFTGDKGITFGEGDNTNFVVTKTQIDTYGEGLLTDALLLGAGTVDGVTSNGTSNYPAALVLDSENGNILLKMSEAYVADGQPLDSTGTWYGMEISRNLNAPVFHNGVNGFKLFHEGNGGHLSLFDADKLDGLHASDFALDGHTHEYLPLTASAAKAVKLETVRDINVIGAVTGTIAFDGSQDVTLTTTLNPATQTSLSGKLDATSKAVDTEKIQGISCDTGLVAPTNTASRLNIHSVLYASQVFNAVWNDYAEYFEKGNETEPGDIVIIDVNSDKEKYIKVTTEKSEEVVGVHSDTFAQCIGGNGDDKDKDNFIPIGMAGRVKVKVVGAVKRGQYIVSSDIPGVGRALGEFEDTPKGSIVGMSVENYDGCAGIKRIKMFIKNL